MHGEIITIGNELTAGRTVDLNSWYAAGRLNACGLCVTRITTVGDDPPMVAEVLTRALAGARFVIVTGGLGSTTDDLTNEIAARALSRPLCLDQRMFHVIRRYAALRGLEVSPAMEKMAWMPEGARLLHPQISFCGFALREKGVPIYFLPGVPDQMRYLMDTLVLPEILGLYRTLPVVRQRVLKVFGLSEPRIAELLRSLQAEEREVAFGFYPQFPETHITLGLRGRNEAAVLENLDRVEKEVRARVGACLFASADETMEQVVGCGLRAKGRTLATAESCSGGLIAHRLTEVPGSSAYFRGGVVAYSNDSKRAMLGLRDETLAAFGAVSEEVVREMALGVRQRLGSDLGLAVSGIAGPEGGTPGKPVGTICLALADDAGVCAGRYRFRGDRQQIKLQTAVMGLDWIRRHVNGDPFLPGVRAAGRDPRRDRPDFP
jgi:nicotinamide-nucleotide amidase